MAGFVGGGLLLDLVLGFTLLEVAVLLLYHRATGRGIAPARLLPNIAAGFCLMLGLRAALGQAHWFWIVLALAGSGLAHAIDLRARWGRAA